MSNLCSHIKSYLFDISLYSSIESTFTLPRSLILFLKELTFFVACAMLSGLLYSPQLFGVSSYSSHSLFVTSSMSSLVLSLFTPILIISSFNPSKTLCFEVISSSVEFSFTFFSSLDAFRLLIVSSLEFILSSRALISSSKLTILVFNSSFSVLIDSIFVFLFSMLVPLLAMSWFILSTISSIETSLSLNEDTEILRFVTSKFKLSMYF